MTSPSSERDRPRKAVLICLECSHQSPPDGDWEVRREASTDVYECPDCSTEITRRPADRDRFERLFDVSTTATSLWNQSVEAVQQRLLL